MTVAVPANIAIETLLLPVDPTAPAGIDLRYQPLFDEIKVARRVADTSPTELAPWKKVADLVLKAAAKSKDLQLAIWLLEAFAHVDGFAGTATGLIILRRMLDDYWESVYPQIEADDSEPLSYRRALLFW